MGQMNCLILNVSKIEEATREESEEYVFKSLAYLLQINSFQLILYSNTRI